KNKRTKKILGGLALIFIALVSYFAYNPEVSLLQNSVAFAYGAGDLILIILTFFMLKVANEFKGGHLFYVWLAFSIGLGLTLLADLSFAIFNQAYTDGNLWITIDLIWIVSFLMFGLGLFGLGNAVREAQ